MAQHTCVLVYVPTASVAVYVNYRSRRSIWWIRAVISICVRDCVYVFPDSIKTYQGQCSCSPSSLHCIDASVGNELHLNFIGPKSGRYWWKLFHDAQHPQPYSVICLERQSILWAKFKSQEATCGCGSPNSGRCHPKMHSAISNHRQVDCVPKRLFRRTSWKTPTLRVTVSDPRPPVAGGFHKQGASNAKNISF